MSTERVYKALANCEQGLSSSEQAQARANIGAQGSLTAGNNITIADGVISATDTTYSAGNGLTLNGTEFSVDTSVVQEKLTAGPNIDIYNNVISTEKPRVTAGTNVSVTSSLDQQTRTITYTVSATDTTYSVFNTTTDGLVPKANGTGDTDKFLKGDGTWGAPAAAPSIVQKQDYGESSASTVSTLLVDSDDADGYAVLKCDNVNKGALVVGPYKGLLDSGINGGSGIGDSSTPIYVDGNGQFATCSITPGGAKRSHTAELYLHHTQDGDHYNVRNVKNYCINHVAVSNHAGDICYLHIEAPTLSTGEEYDYIVVFDCTNSSGGCNVTVQNCDPEIVDWPYYEPQGPGGIPAVAFQDVTRTRIEFSTSPKYQVDVIGTMFCVRRA